MMATISPTLKKAFDAAVQLSVDQQDVLGTHLLREVERAAGDSEAALINDVDTLDRPVIASQARENDANAAADELCRVIEQAAGRSPEGWKFSREEIYRERLDRYR